MRRTTTADRHLATRIEAAGVPADYPWCEEKSMRRGTGKRLAVLIGAIVVLVGVGVYVALQFGSRSDERALKALAAREGDVEADVLRAAGPPTVRRAIDAHSPKDVCSTDVNPTSAWALEWAAPNDGIGKWLRTVTGPSSRVYVCLDAAQKVVNTYRFVY
jgi:hypothetical protein